MSKSYRSIMKNLKNYIESTFNVVISEKNLNIDYKTYTKSYKKTEYEKELDEDAKDWFQNIKLYDFDYTFFNEKVIFFKYINQKQNSHKQGTYMLYSSLEKIDFPPELNSFMENVELNLGMFLSLFEKEKVDWYPLTINDISNDALIDILDLKYDSNTVNHEFGDILGLFGSISVFKIKEEFLDNNSDLIDLENFKFRTLGILKANQKQNNILKGSYLSMESIEEYKKVFINDVNKFPYENLYLSLNHNSPKYIFLEIYRIIEKLYPIIYCHIVKKKLNIKDKDLFKIQEFMMKDLIWKHKERCSINEIFKHLEKNPINRNYINNIKKFKNYLCKEDKSISNWIYDIRNSSVHLSLNYDEENGKTDIKKIFNGEDTLIKNLIPLLVNIYNDLFV